METVQIDVLGTAWGFVVCYAVFGAAAFLAVAGSSIAVRVIVWIEDKGIE